MEWDRAAIGGRREFHLHLETETVQQVDSEEPLFVAPETSLRDVLTQMKSNRQGSVLIREGDKGVLAGIFTERDALRTMANRADQDRPIREYMKNDPVTVLATDTVARAIQLMSEGGYRRLPIVNESGLPLGIVKVSHILSYLVEHFPGFIYNLPPAPHHATQNREGA